MDILGTGRVYNILLLQAIHDGLLVHSILTCQPVRDQICPVPNAIPGVWNGTWHTAETR